jgi:DNA-binding Xre family transcriptional regulator
MKLQEQLTKKEMTGKELAEKIGTDVGMVSRFNNYKCLPVPAMLEDICKALNCEINDIYSNEEITFKKANKRPASGDFTNYKITVRLPRDAKEKIHKALKVCGYKDVTYWIYRCYERLITQQEIIEKAQKRKDLQASASQFKSQGASNNGARNIV